MNIALCDDEPRELENLQALVDDYADKNHLLFTVSRFNSGEELLASIAQGNRYDIVFLDIVMGQANGVVTARTIRESDKKCSIIFATNSMDYAIAGYGVKALQYLLKPIGCEALVGVLEQALEVQKANVPHSIYIKTRQGDYCVPLEDILYAESSARVINLHQRKGEPVRFYERLDKFELQCKDVRFLRCHMSFLVNMDYVRSIADNCILLETGRKIPVSMAISRAKEIFASYTANKI